MTLPFFRLLAAIAILAVTFPNTALGQSLTVENASSNDRLTTIQQTELVRYVQGRYRRVKATIEQDRAQARHYLTAEAWSEYTDKFHPQSALPDFKRCTTCAEFGIHVTHMWNLGCSIIRLSMHEPGDMHCDTIVEFQTVPITPANGPVQVMASRLDWRPRGAVSIPPYEDVADVMPNASHDIEIMEDERQVQQRPLGTCLSNAANGTICH
ncbi:MAG: hypothetical protein EPN68_15050 [Rhodanobacter sp.]|nr:MAG: hypothetical protein EPN68_15050 [Rhodanobacter sp.]